MGKIWKLKSEVPQDLAEKFPDLNPLVLRLLYNRGLVKREEIEEFLDPKYEKLNDPFLFRDMQKAVDRIWQAIENQEKIFIYGDYDADAVTANAALQQTFRYLGVEVESYVPDRFTEGYGLNLEAFAKIKSAGAKLIITVDCGTNSTDAADFCAQNQIDLIITDHHIILGDKPKAFALINPKNPDDNYPYHDITGVGVAFKLACGILSHYDRVAAQLSSRPSPNDNEGESRDPEQSQGLDSGYPPTANSGMTEKKYTGGWEKWLLDLVAIGTVADCHSLIGENRILVKYGLKVLAKTKWPGLRALVAAAGLDFSQKAPDAYTLGFVIAPRINAAGRLEHANIALNLLLQKDPVAGQQMAQTLEEIEHKTEAVEESALVDAVERLEKLNLRRRETTEMILSEAKEKVIAIADRKILIIMGDWNKGVVGLVAGKIADEYHKPTIVLSIDGEEAVGSARSVGGFNIVEALEYASAFLIRYGGHQQAAGLTLRKADFELFYQKILEYAQEHLTEEDLQGVLQLEAEILPPDLNLDTVGLIEQFQPFGVGNPRPKFLLNNCRVAAFRAVGNNQNHLQMSLEFYGKTISAIAFNRGFLAKTLKIGDAIDAAVELMEDGWNGRREIKLRIVDIKRNSK